VNLFKFLDWVLSLPKGLEDEFWTELKAYEKERNMPYITSVERIGYERGRKEGRVEDRRSIISRQLEQKIGQIPETLSNRISTLSLDQLDVLLIDFLNFNSIDDLSTWLDSNT
jgi:predicted transposase YdaD